MERGALESKARATLEAIAGLTDTPESREMARRLVHNFIGLEEDKKAALDALREELSNPEIGQKLQGRAKAGLLEVLNQYRHKLGQ